jgi:2,3-bisphosphoglycerate-independent phosphoglycerate mutase
MDRDKRWERIKLAYDMLVGGQGELTSNLMQTVEERYAKDETDEFLKPIIANPEGTIRDGDTVICFNYRSDRMREISQALGAFPAMPFETDKPLKNVVCYLFASEEDVF